MDKYEVNVCRTFQLTQEDIDDIVCTALEGGINYWCRKAEVVDDDYYGEYASEQVSRGGSLRLYDREEKKTYILTLEKLLNGIKLYLEDYYDSYCIVDGKIETSMVDAPASDCMVQYAVFGELVYG